MKKNKILIISLWFLSIHTFALSHTDHPVIGKISVDQKIMINTPFTLFAYDVTDNDQIARVWAAVQRSKNITQTIDLKQTGPKSNHYKCQIDGFSEPGSYTAAIVAMDWTGNQSTPYPITLHVHKGVYRRAIIIAGGEQTDSLWPSVQTSVSLVWNALKNRQYLPDDMTLVSQNRISGIDKIPIDSSGRNIQQLLFSFNENNTEDILIYMAGYRHTKGFSLNQTENLMPDDLDLWLDDCQNRGIDKTLVFCDFSGSGQFINELLPPENKHRLLIASSSIDETAWTIHSSGFLWSHLFWSHVLYHGNIGDAWQQVSRIISWDTFRQAPCLDINADGVCNDSSDLHLAFQHNIGDAVVSSDDIPVFETIGCQADGTIQVQFTNYSYVDTVQAIIFPPEFNALSDHYAMQQLNSIQLSQQMHHFSGIYDALYLNGLYQVYLYASSPSGMVSTLQKCSINNEKALPDPYEDDNIWEKAHQIKFSSYKKNYSTHPQWHNFHTQGDVDWVKLHAHAGMTYIIEVKDVSDQADPIIALYDTDGETLLSIIHDNPVDINFNGQGEYIEWECHQSGTYFAKIYQCDPKTEGCASSYGEQTRYQLLFYSPILTFPGLIWGFIDPPNANATIKTIRNTVYQISSGFYFLRNITGTVTVEIFADGFETLVDSIKIPICLEPDKFPIENRVDIKLKPENTSPIADFSGTPTKGFFPLTVTFTNKSQQADQWIWKFGDFTQSQEKNPVHVFDNPGRYSVELTAISPSGQDTRNKTNYIHVKAPKPQANFKAVEKVGTAPFFVQWTDLSSGMIEEWHWDFGDGATSSASNPTHTYNKSGMFYTVSLTVEGPGGFDTKVMEHYIHVKDLPPIANFHMIPENGVAPLTVQFFDQSQEKITQRTWTIDKITDSQSLNPKHTFQTPGTYTIILNVSGPGGQSVKEASLDVLWPSPRANFIAQQTSGDMPLDVQFNDHSSGNITQWFWNFGDNQTSQEQHPNHRFNEATSFTVQLTVTGPGGTDTKKRINYIDVNQPIPPLDADFSASQITGKAPLGVDFSDESSGLITHWTWDFGDGSRAHDPVVNHVYQRPGTYSVRLTVSNSTQNDTIEKAALIHVDWPQPVAQFSVSASSGIVPLTMTFINESTGNIRDYLWSFGDGFTSKAYYPVHVYPYPGTYSVSLTVSGPGGIDTMIKKNAVTANWPAPKADFMVQNNSGETPLTVQVMDTSVVQVNGEITSWQWLFGDGQSAFGQTVSHTYSSSGTYDITLIVSGPGGMDSKTYKNAVHVIDPVPIPNFSAYPTQGDAPKRIQFTDQSIGNIEEWLWNFGDGQISHEQNPSHQYEKPGQYPVSLTTTGPGGSKTLMREQYIDIHWGIPLVAFSASPTSGVAPLTVEFTDQSTGLIQGWFWMFGDETSKNDHPDDISRRQQHPTHTYTRAGQYSVSLTVSNPDTRRTQKKDLFITVHPMKPRAIFIANPRNGQAPLTVLFENNSQGDIHSFHWDFGDGEISDNMKPIHTYQKPGSYTVSLTVEGPGGTDQSIKYNYITQFAPPPVADFYGVPTKGTAPLTVCFKEILNQDIDQSTWDFGDSIIQSISNPCHDYISAGIYTVQLTVQNSGGSNTKIRTDYIHVTEPPALNADFYARISKGVAPLTVQFINTTSDKTANMHWNFGDLTQSEDIHPTHTYTQAGEYTVSLIAITDADRDEKTRLHYIQVTHPKPIANFINSPKEGIAPLVSQFNDCSQQYIDQWLWDFGDGNKSNQQNPQHIYQKPGTYTVSLTVIGPGGIDTHTASCVQVHEALKADFSFSCPSPYAPARVYLSNHSTGRILGYNWNFDDGTFSKQKHPYKIFNRPGIYWIKLDIYGPDGTDTMTSALAIDIKVPSQRQYYQHIQRIPADENRTILNKPFGITQQSDNNLIIADYGDNQIQLFENNVDWIDFDSDNTFQLSGPSGVCKDKSDNIYISDTANHCIKVFSNTVEFIRKWGSLGSNPGQFDFPLSLTLDADNTIYVADTNNHRIQKFTISGDFICQWGQWGNAYNEMDHPSGIAVDAGTVYISDSGNNRILLYTTKGQYLDQWPTLSSFPYHVATDQTGCLYVSDIWSKAVFKYNMLGHMLSRIGGDNLSIQFPTHLYVNAKGSLFVSDTQGDEILVFQLMNNCQKDPLVMIIEILRFLSGTDVAVECFNDLDDDGVLGIKTVLWMIKKAAEM